MPSADVEREQMTSRLFLPDLGIIQEYGDFLLEFYLIRLSVIRPAQIPEKFHSASGWSVSSGCSGTSRKEEPSFLEGNTGKDDALETLSSKIVGVGGRCAKRMLQALTSRRCTVGQLRQCMEKVLVLLAVAGSYTFSRVLWLVGSTTFAIQSISSFFHCRSSVFPSVFEVEMLPSSCSRVSACL